MWTVIHIVQNKSKAEEIYRKLTSDGFLVKIQSTGKNEDISNFQILVPETEAEEAYDLIMELGLT